MATASISLRDVGRTFGATRALAGVDLDLKPGVTGLLGPNGAGKTTLLRLLATALPPSQGQVRVLGLDPEVPAERTGIRRQLGYQPQEVGFPRGFTAFAFVDYIALLKEQSQPAARHAEVRRVLDLVGLSDLGAKRIRAMSGGQRRRVSLAQALLGSPPVLILDEPTTGVDPEQRVVLRTVLAELARTSIVVLSTHQTEDVAALCERVIVLDRGRVRYDGPVTDLTGQAAGRVWLADEPDPAASVSWRTGTGRYRNVGARVRDDVEHVEPSLEDAYLLLRGGSPETRDRRGGGVMTADARRLAAGPAAAAGRATFAALAARETRRFVLNPVFLFAVAITVYALWAGPAHGHRDRQREPVPGDLPRRVRHDGHVLADPVDARQRTGRRRHPGHAAGPHRRPVRGRDRAVRLRLPRPAEVRAAHPGQQPALRAVQPIRAGRRPGRADRDPSARRPAARCRAGPLGAVPGRRVRAVPAPVRLGAAW